MNDLEQITKLLGVEGSEEMSTAEIYELLCQIALALLIIFMMANVLFMARTKADIEAAKGMVGVLRGELDGYKNTPKGEIIDARDKALVNLQRQKLCLALEEVENAERNDFGISFFTKKNPNGETEYLMSDILSQGKVINERFRKACILAKESLSDRKKMQSEWLSRVCLVKGMQLSDSPVEELIVEHPEIITKDNAQWLFQEIDIRIKAIYVDCCDMQAMALSYLVEYYAEHTDVLMGSKLGKQLDKALSAPLEDRIRLVSEFSKELYRYVKLLFERQEVPLLTGV